jgi:hypothetical protein
MSKPLRQLIAAAVLGLGSMAAMAGGHVNWSVGINLPPAGVVVSNGPTYYAPPPVYRAAPPVYYAPAPIVYQPPPVIYRPAPVYGGWGYQAPPHWHGGHRGRGWDRDHDGDRGRGWDDRRHGH